MSTLEEFDIEPSPARHRAYRLTDDARDAIAHRPEGTKIREFLAETVSERLTPLVRSLTALGIRRHPDTRPARLPVTEQVLADLAEASNITGIPAAHLLLAVLTTQSPPLPPISNITTRKTASGKSSTATKSAASKGRGKPGRKSKTSKTEQESVKPERKPRGGRPRKQIPSESPPSEVLQEDQQSTEIENADEAKAAEPIVSTDSASQA